MGSNVYRMSNVSKCARALYLEHYHGRSPIDSETQKRFDDGIAIHEMIQNKYLSEYENSVKEFAVEISCNGFIITGHIDLILQNFVVEIKSIKTMVKKPLNDHIAQINLYMHAANIKNGCLLYYAKDTKQELLFSVRYSRNMAFEDIGYFEMLYNSITRKHIPNCSCIPSFKHYHCKTIT